MSELHYWLWLSGCKGLTAFGAQKYLRRFGSAKAIFYASVQELAQVEGAQRRELAALAHKHLAAAEKLEADCAARGVQILSLQDADYPERLRNIPDPPLALYLQGQLPPVDDRLCIGVVGTRKASDYGKSSARQVGKELAELGAVVVTGLAEGVDTAAAKGALSAHGTVIGVLGTATDQVYPPWNSRLQEAVAKVGTLISEYPPGAGATRYSFPQRNRIISGLSLGVAVIQAPERSGSLITAARAQEQGRDVFVLPGQAGDPGFAGSHALIRDGAQLICSAADIVEEYRARFPEMSSIPQKVTRQDAKNDVKKHLDKPIAVGYHSSEEKRAALTELEARLIRLLAEEPAYADGLIRGSEAAAGEVLAALTMLQLRGYLAEQSGCYRLLAPGKAAAAAFSDRK